MTNLISPSRFIQTPLKMKSIKEILIHYLFKQFYSHPSVLFIDNTLEVHLTSRKFRYQRLLRNIYVWLFQCIKPVPVSARSKA